MKAKNTNYHVGVNPSMIEVDRLVFCYGATEVLHEISFSLQRGEIVGLLGPNGAGKSTTIKILAGILSPTRGRVMVAGQSLPDQAVELKERIGYVPESATLFETLSGQEFLELLGRLQEVPEDTLQSRIRNTLERFDLAKDRLRRLEGYSKGMKQKILLAAALIHNPQIILMDEPLSGLDVNAAIMVKDLIAALAAEGKTILYSSHILDVVERICDRVLIIQQGNLIADGSLESLKTSTQRSTLEDVFRQLTHTEDSPNVAGIIEGLR
jgi:ABC-2 type transport system ATP-binding protein